MSTIKVNKIENTGTTAGGVEIDSSGHVQVDGLQMPTAGPLSNRNLIINGAMQVAQRGTSSTASNYGSVDRWYMQTSGGTTTHTQTAITSGDPYNEGFRYVARLTNTTAATGAGDYRNPLQHIEAQNIAQSGWNYKSSSSYITLSFWVRSSVSQEFFGFLRSRDGTEQAYSFSMGTLAADTWTKVTKSIPGNSNLTFDNDANSGLILNLSIFWGTNFTTSGKANDAWAAYSGSSRVPDTATTWASTAGATFDFTGVQLELGEKATAFSHEPFSVTLAKCQRYFETSYPPGTSVGSVSNTAPTAQCVKTNSFRAWQDFKVTKRATPTVKFYSSNSGTVDKLYNASDAADVNVIADNHSENGARVSVDAGGDGELLRWNYTAEAEL